MVGRMSARPLSELALSRRGAGGDLQEGICMALSSAAPVVRHQSPRSARRPVHGTCGKAIAMETPERARPRNAVAVGKARNCHDQPLNGVAIMGQCFHKERRFFAEQ